ncbi:hypothetical protein EGY25_04320 [Brevundimonas intermedia]|uniref:Uncharacterized protein n=1 Tax=Brevundimonas intermedia TaxID=74315 RepID=A0A4Y9RZD5_9CAUL|nr:hypothetical protein [Brevundimonas intermedia]TFW14424.1 hypothetical protein EGY25_04320 [Brevundimonas intermedia]
MIETVNKAVGRRRVAAAVFLRIATSPKVARAWSGSGGFTVPPDAVDPTGGRYLGCGWMQNLPALEVLLNGAAESTTFTLSGVDDRTVELVDREGGVRGVRANLGVMFYGPRMRRTPVEWFRRWRVDMVGTREIAVSSESMDAEALSMSVSLTLGSARTSRRVGQPALWTHAEQNRLHPGDNSMSLVGRLSADATRPHPPIA